MKLTNLEDKLLGKLILENNTVKNDEVALRIEWLIKHHLKKIGTDLSGWDTFYIDPDDNRLWELMYLQSEMHGGGPPSLFYISQEEARMKYREVYT